MILVRRTEDLATCHALRRRVFIEEQNVSEAEELDGLDGEAIHLLAFENGQAVGSARLLLSGETGKIGRVCVLAEMRGKGVGQALMRAALSELRGIQGLRLAKLGAQSHAIGFYEALGFEAYGSEYLDAGIPHRDMQIRL